MIFLIINQEKELQKNKFPRAYLKMKNRIGKIKIWNYSKIFDLKQVCLNFWLPNVRLS